MNWDSIHKYSAQGCFSMMSYLGQRMSNVMPLLLFSDELCASMMLLGIPNPKDQPHQPFLKYLITNPTLPLSLRIDC